MKIILMMLFYLATSSNLLNYQSKYIDPAQRLIRQSQDDNKVQSNNIKVQKTQQTTSTISTQQQRIQEDIQLLRSSAKFVFPRSLTEGNISPEDKSKTEAERLKEGVQRPEDVKNLMPNDNEYDAIKLSLESLIALFIIIQLLSCVCKKKKKRYGQKFEQYAQRSEGQQQDEEIQGQK